MSNLTPAGLRARAIATVRNIVTPRAQADVSDDMVPVVFSPLYQPITAAFTALVTEARRAQREAERLYWIDLLCALLYAPLMTCVECLEGSPCTAQPSCEVRRRNHERAVNLATLRAHEETP